MTQYVLVSEQSSEAMFCLGVYNDYHEAVGHAMDSIWDFKESYKGEDDFFEYTEPMPMEGDGGEFISVKYKAACWTHMDKPQEEFYYILYHTVGEEIKHD